MDWATESSSSTTSFLILVAELDLSAPGLGKMIPALARLHSGRWLGHLRLAVLLWGHQNHAQRCCFVQSPAGRHEGMLTALVLLEFETSFLYCKGTLCPPGVGAGPKLGSSHFLCIWQEK